MLLNEMRVSSKQHIIGTFIFIYSDNLCLLIGTLGHLYLFIDMMAHTFAILFFVFFIFWFPSSAYFYLASYKLT